MGRRPRTSAAELVQHALRLAARGGASAVTMKGVAKSAGTPSGSVYHRFASRPQLLAEVWHAALARFVDDYAAAVPKHTSPGDYAVFVVRWARRHRIEASVLMLHSAAEFVGDETPAALREGIASLRRQSMAAMAAIARSLVGNTRKPSLARLRFALSDIPLAALRQPLRTGAPIPRYAEQLVREAADALLASERTQDE